MVAHRQIHRFYKLVFKSKIKYAIKNSMSLAVGIYGKHITRVGHYLMSFYANLTKDKLASSTQGGKRQTTHI